MPIVECDCGMVMSVASGGRRTSCIRCGVQLHVLNGTKEPSPTRQESPAKLPSSSTGPAPEPKKMFLPRIPLYATISEPLSAGPHA